MFFNIFIFVSCSVFYTPCKLKKNNKLLQLTYYIGISTNGTGIIGN